MKKIWELIMCLFGGSSEETEADSVHKDEEQEMETEKQARLEAERQTEKNRLKEEALKEKEAARIAAIKAAYAACDQNYLVVSGLSHSEYIHVYGDLEIDGLIFEGEDILYTMSDPTEGLKPKEEFLSFMYAKGWEITSFSVNGEQNFSYTMIFKKRGN